MDINVKRKLKRQGNTLISVQQLIRTFKYRYVNKKIKNTKYVKRLEVKEKKGISV